jgi:hypothetical protein
MRTCVLRLFVHLLALVALLLATGCARLTSIHRAAVVPLDRPNTISVDAKQRMVLSQPAPNGRPALRFCTEPPPDVFSALAASLGVDASVSGQGARDATARLASTLSENASTIERTQTINVLRESMYRNCERYLSGAINDDEFIVQAARDQQLIVQVLAIEQITGAARAQASALTTVAKAAASGVTDTGLQTLAAAKKDVDARRGISDKAVADAGSLPPEGPCGSLPLDPTAPPTGISATQATAKNDACATAKAALARLKESESYFATVQNAVDRQSEVSSTASGAVSSAALSAAAVSESVAKQVVDIVKQNHVLDEIVMACVVKVRRNEPITPLCERVLDGMLATRQAQLLSIEGYSVGEVNQRINVIVEETRTAAGVVFSWLEKRGGNTPDNIRTLAKAAGITIPVRTLNALASSGTNETSFALAFQRLSKLDQSALLSAAK